MDKEHSTFLFDDTEKSTYQKLSPVIRFWRYIQSEKKHIWHIYIYAVIVGLIGLSLPLGIQAVIQMISGGILYDTALLIIILVLIGVAITGALQVMQIYMVEILQRRLFAKATFEFSHRLPRIKADELVGSYAPEVVNRFFDVVILQKGISKILIDLTSAVLQVLFGLILLAFYHPSFIMFDLVFITAAFIVFRFTGKKGLETSIKESSYKYKMAAWLQEIARNQKGFKMSGSNSNFVTEKTDEYTVKYLTARKTHFKVLVTQYINILVFKISIIAATLFLGSLLVVDRQINLGQFVATELIIVLILGAIEKIIISVDTVYDSFTATDKISKISDYNFEKEGNIEAADYITDKGITIEFKKVGYKKILTATNLTIAPGSTVVLAGQNSYATEAVLNIICGIYQDYTGLAEINGISIKELALAGYRKNIAHNLAGDCLFEGSILENITMGGTDVAEIEVVKTLTALGVYDTVALMPQGIHTKLLPGGIGLPDELAIKVAMARSILRKPKLWIVDEQHFAHAQACRKLVGGALTQATMLVLSNNATTHAVADNIYLFNNGSLIAEGTAAALQNNELYKKITA